MGPTLPVGIQDPVPIDNLVVLVLQEREAVISGKLLLKLLDELLGIIVAVDAHRENLNLVFFLFI
jgi:hypothetical protein